MTKSSRLMAHDFLPDSEDLVLGLGENKDKALRIVMARPDGIGTPDIAKALGIAVNTALKILRELEAERELYSVKFGKVTVWHPNGRLVHPYLELFKELRGVPYRFSVQEGRSGPLLQIQERSYSLLTGERVEGAVFVEFKVIEDFMEGLEEIMTRFKDFAEAGVTR